MDDAQQGFMDSITSPQVNAGNAFTHAANLLRPDSSGDILEFNQICGKNLALAVIESDILLRLYQNDEILLTEAFAFALRDKRLKPLFMMMCYSWYGELIATRAKNGKERTMQGGPGVGVRLQGSAGQSMGMGFYEPEVQQPQKDSRNFFDRVFNRNKG